MGLTLTQAFQIHAVVGILFCLPVFTSGISGFLETITNGQLTDPDMFTLHLAGVDFSKNMCSCGVLYYLRVVRVGIACHVHVASMVPRVTPSTRCPTQEPQARLLQRQRRRDRGPRDFHHHRGLRMRHLRLLLRPTKQVEEHPAAGATAANGDAGPWATD